MSTETMKEITDTFSKFRELQRQTGAIPNTCNGLHRVYLVHGDEGQVLEIGFAQDARLALIKASERITSNSINDQLRHARGIVVETSSRAHYPKSENHPDPETTPLTLEQVEEHFHSAEIVLTIGVNTAGTFCRSSIAGEHTLPTEAIEGLPMREVEQMTSDHPLAPVFSLVETLHLAVDTARQIIERDGKLPEHPGDIDD